MLNFSDNYFDSMLDNEQNYREQMYADYDYCDMRKEQIKHLLDRIDHYENLDWLFQIVKEISTLD